LIEPGRVIFSRRSVLMCVLQKLAGKQPAPATFQVKNFPRIRKNGLGVTAAIFAYEPRAGGRLGFCPPAARARRKRMVEARRRLVARAHVRAASFSASRLTRARKGSPSRRMPRRDSPAVASERNADRWWGTAASALARCTSLARVAGVAVWARSSGSRLKPRLPMRFPTVIAQHNPALFWHLCAVPAM